jgi:minimal PKS ketosynthase (KS/KS alpha)
VTRRVVVTGMGVTAPGGIGIPAFWELLTAGRPVTRPITLFDASPFQSRIAAECDFHPTAPGMTTSDARWLDRYLQFATTATAEALHGSGLNPAEEDEWRIGVVMGTALGSATLLEQNYVVMSDGGMRWEVDHRYGSPHLRLAWTPSVLSAETARLCGARGPVRTVSTGCTSGIDAVGYAAQLILDGDADVVVAGGAESPISPATVGALNAVGAMSSRNDDPEHSCRPFDRDRDGFVLGEGAAVLVVEELRHAVRRNATVLCEVSGYATVGNAHHMTGLDTDGRALAVAITQTLTQARLGAMDVDYISANGTATRQNDLHETNAVKLALGQYAYSVPMSSIKSMIGHSLGAGGAIELVACALAIERGVVPPTANLTAPDPDCDLDYVSGTARECRVDVALSVASGFGGFQSALALRRAGTSQP